MTNDLSALLAGALGNGDPADMADMARDLRHTLRNDATLHPVNVSDALEKVHEQYKDDRILGPIMHKVTEHMAINTFDVSFQQATIAIEYTKGGTHFSHALGAVGEMLESVFMNGQLVGLTDACVRFVILTRQANVPEDAIEDGIRRNLEREMYVEENDENYKDMSLAEMIEAVAILKAGKLVQLVQAYLEADSSGGEAPAIAILNHSTVQKALEHEIDIATLVDEAVAKQGKHEGPGQYL
jgi:hypothetical protein